MKLDQCKLLKDVVLISACKQEMSVREAERAHKRLKGTLDLRDIQYTTGTGNAPGDSFYEELCVVPSLAACRMPWPLRNRLPKFKEMLQTLLVKLCDIGKMFGQAYILWVNQNGVAMAVNCETHDVKTLGPMIQVEQWMPSEVHVAARDAFTYMDSTGALYTIYPKFTSTVTGRLCCTVPNYEEIPKQPIKSAYAGKAVNAADFAAKAHTRRTYPFGPAGNPVYQGRED